MNHEKLNWLKLADKFAVDGDPKGMRACAKELWQLDPSGMDGAAVMAEAALYTGETEEAQDLVEEILNEQADMLVHTSGKDMNIYESILKGMEFAINKFHQIDANSRF